MADRIAHAVARLPLKLAGLAAATALCLSAEAAFAQMGGLPISAPPPPPTLAHQVLLLIVGAVIGAIVGPIGTAIASRILPSADKQLRLDELAALRELTAALKAQSSERP